MRPTPFTNSASFTATHLGAEVRCVQSEVCANLERSRDEAVERMKNLCDALDEYGEAKFFGIDASDDDDEGEIEKLAKKVDAELEAARAFLSAREGKS